MTTTTSEYNPRSGSYVFKYTTSVRWILVTVALVAHVLSRSFLFGQITEGTTITVLNRSAFVQPDGSWRIDNLPANAGAMRARATLLKNGKTIIGQSELVNIQPGIQNGFGAITFGSATQIPAKLSLTATPATLGQAGAISQITATATYPDATTRDVTAPAEGTSYTVTNPAIATVSGSGILTAVSSGTVLVSALNDGVVGIIQMKVVLSGVDTDGDGIPDDVEIANGLNPNDPVDGKEDPDGDGLSNYEELMVYGTNRLISDTDGDGISDGDEVRGKLGKVTNPLLKDTDGDLINDLLEFQAGTDPTNSASFNFGAALQSISVSPSQFVLTASALNPGEASRQLAVTGVLKDLTTVDLTAKSRGTSYSSSDLLVAKLNSVDGKIVAGNPGNATVTVRNGNFTAAVGVTVQSSNPAALGSVAIPGYANHVAVSGNYAFVAAGSTGLQVVDVTNKLNPVVVASIDTPGNANDVRIAGNLAYVADGASGLRIISIANPLAPTLIGTVDTPGNASDIALAGGVCYLADGSAGLQVIDISTPTAPRIIGAFQTVGPAKGVDVFGLIAVVAEGGSGLQVLNIANPAVPQLLGAPPTFEFGNAQDVAIRGRYAYVAEYFRGLIIVDLFDPRAPLVAGISYQTGGFLTDVILDGSLAFGASLSFGSPPKTSVTIFNTTIATNPTFLQNFALSTTPSIGTGLTLDGGYVYLTADIAPANINVIEDGVSGTTRLFIGQYFPVTDARGVPPAAKITEPPTGALVVQGETITINVDAQDDVAVARVRLLVNGALVDSVSVAPYIFTYTAPKTSGQAILTAIATDFGGNSTTSAANLIEIVPDPGTTVTGRIVNASGVAVVGAKATVFGTYFALTDGSGNFQITGVPTIRGNVTVAATFQSGSSNLSGTSAAIAAVPNGTANVGSVTIR